MAGKLNDRQQLFVLEYLVDRNATQAAIRAGYSEKTAYSIGQRLLKHVEVAAEIQKRCAAISEKLEITQERVLQELAAIGFAKLPDFVTVETERDTKLGIHPITGEVITLPAGWCQYVKVLDTAELTAPQQAAISSIKQTAHGVEIKLHDKARALELLGKATGAFDGAANAPTLNNNLFDAIVGTVEEDLGADEIPELEQAAAAGDDVVEPPLAQKP